MSIADKVVAITGGGSGIGRATAIMLAERGAKVVVGGRRASGLDATVATIASEGGMALAQVTDVTRRADVDALVAAAHAAFGRLDVIVNAAGIGPLSRFDRLNTEDWDAMIDINLRGVLHGIAAALPVFAAQRDGHVVNVISTAGITLTPTMGLYAATKNAVRTATEILRKESGPDLRVTEISPGMVATSFVDSITDEAARSQIKEKVDEIGIPPEAIARAIAFAIEQPRDVTVASMVIYPTAQE